MPHIQIDYTANLELEVQERKLVNLLHQTAVESGIFPEWGIRTMAKLFFDAPLLSMGQVFETRRLGCQVEVMEFDAKLTYIENNLAEDVNSVTKVIRRLIPPAVHMQSARG